jgi:hypothetical protein
MPSFWSSLSLRMIWKFVVPVVETTGLPARSRELGDVGAGLHQEARAGVEVVGREGDLLAALAVVGGRAALDVDRAVLQQRDSVGRGHRLVLELEVVAAGRLLDAVDDLLADLEAEAGRLRVAAEVRERDRRLAVGERHASALLDLVERRRLREGERGKAQREQAEGAKQGVCHERGPRGECG